MSREEVELKIIHSVDELKALAEQLQNTNAMVAFSLLCDPLMGCMQK